MSFMFSPDQNKPKSKLDVIFEKIENPIFKFCNIDTTKNMSSKEYFLTLFLSNIIISVICFFILYWQSSLPFKGNVHYKLEVPLILHILSSLITNTCQTHHISETQLTHLSNYFVMPLLMFYSSASGIATGIVFMRAIVLGHIGNFFVDVTKSMTRILFPISFIISIIFTACGMPNTFKSFVHYESLENIKQTLLLGPVAAFEAIKLFGENGLSCFTANSAHPFENPTYFSNFLQIISVLIVPFALIFTLGFWLKNHKQSLIILLVLTTVLFTEFFLTTSHELKGNRVINNLLNIHSPNWVGKETRFGIVGSSVFSAAISNVSGASNSSLDSFHPIINLLGLFNLSNQAIFGVQGFGTVFTINFIILSTFLIGLMIGKTPEIFGKRIEKNEIILGSILLLINPVIVLFGVATTLYLFPENFSDIYEKVHYYTRVFYEFASGAASNGSGLEGLSDNNAYWNYSLAITMFVARYAACSCMIFLAGSLANKPAASANVSTFRTDTLLFGFLFLFMAVTSTLLLYLPFLTLGPIYEIFLNN